MRGRGRPKHPDILTPREWEVLALLRERKTNEQIAEALDVSLATARYHVSEILGKLGVSSREEAAAWQPPPERRTWLLAPLGLLRRIEALGAPARVAAGGVVALAAVGIALLAWGVFTTGSPKSDAQDAGAAASNTPVACAPASAGQSNGELGTAPIFWRFGLAQDYLTSGQLCDRNLKIVFRVTTTTSCVAGFPTVQQFSDVVQAGNINTGEHLSAPVTCITCPGTDCPSVGLPGVYLVTGFELPSAGEWRLQVRFGNDFSTQTVRIGGPGAPSVNAGPEPPCDPPQPAGGGPAMAAVIVDRVTGHCHVVPTADRIMQAQWVEDGKSFVAYDTDENCFVIYDMNGYALQPIFLKVPADGTIGGTVDPAPDGRAILVDREDHNAGVYSFAVRDVATGQDHDFPQPDGVNGEPSFSPDGKHAAYINTNDGKQSLVIATMPLTDGRYAISETAADGMSFVPIGWSQDGTYLLVERDQTDAPCATPDPNCHQFGVVRTYEVIAADGSPSGTTVWLSPQFTSGVFPNVQWAGEDRLLVADASVKYVDIPSGKESDANAALGSLEAFSPDGSATVDGNSLVDVRTLKRMQALAYNATYMSDWTDDSSKVLLSFGGN